MKRMGLLLLVLLPVSPFAISQATSTPASTATVPISPPAQVITLGNSAVPLTGPWKFQPGDSPWVKGSPLWAQPGFDDSRWAAMDMTPKAGAVDLQIGTSGYLPGWTRKGYPELSGYAWYRLRLKVSDPGQALWLKMPNDVDDAYQVYANGRYVGQFGGFSPGHVTLYLSRPISFALPAPGPDGEIALALRFYMFPSTRFSNPDVGGMHAPPSLGLASTVRLMQASETDALLHSVFGYFLETLVYLLVAPLALWAWLRNRRERAWLWLFLVIVLDVVFDAVRLLSAQTALISGGPADFWEILISVFLRPLWVMFWWRWFGLRERRWIPRTAWLLAVAFFPALFCADSPLMGFSFVPQSASHWFYMASIWCSAALGALLVVILVEGFRRERTEALLAALPIGLELFSVFSSYLLATFDIPAVFFPFGLGINITNIVYILMVLIITVLALRRFVRTQVREEVTRKAIAQDLEQAQQLQQRVLVPEVIISPNFTIETEYRPAQTVGGDFFQTLTRPDGSLLVVIGDVSGKGMSAAMLVAVLVGAIRTRADESFDPASMLATLNQRLIGRAGGHFATCLAAELNPDGTMRIANAGHLPPYLNGKELEIEGSLPLGIVGDAEYVEQSFTLKQGDRLTFVTDGVVEATNAAHELYGFERTREISRERATAIVDAAQRFGQEDDITVVGVEFAGAAIRA